MAIDPTPSVNTIEHFIPLPHQFATHRAIGPGANELASDGNGTGCGTCSRLVPPKPDWRGQ